MANIGTKHAALPALRAGGWREMREGAEKSLSRVATWADVCEPTVRRFEQGGPDAIRDSRKRNALLCVYGHLAAMAQARAELREQEAWLRAQGPETDRG
ncbi:MAG TPA: hypothetical protein VHB21_08895 [Minicystis sp.]|nr:hypothetical protein [Minicystis sp.]